nr:MAG TPA: hypothetical protein [Caudoviricetes sp.]
MLEFEESLIILRSMIDNLGILSTSEEVDETAFGSALFGIAETMDYHIKKIENSFEEGCKNGNF